MATDPKIRPDHLRRNAVVYVRQSTAQQVRGDRESATRQYALADRAKALGWPAAAVQTIDGAQGRSAARSDQGAGFKALRAEVGTGRVGVVLALEASRLARSSVDWPGWSRSTWSPGPCWPTSRRCTTRGTSTTGFCSG